MAMRRKLLKSMGLTDEQIESVVEAHEETIAGLRDALKVEAGKLTAVQKELDDLKKSDWKQAHDAVKKELDDLRAENDRAARETGLRDAYRKLLEAENIDPGKIDLILRKDASALKDEPLDQSGAFVNADKLREGIRADWGGYVARTETRGAKVATPPAGGKVTRTREEIMAIKDTAERQKAIAENHELFGI